MSEKILSVLAFIASSILIAIVAWVSMNYFNPSDFEKQVLLVVSCLPMAASAGLVFKAFPRKP